jgi:hypothetical protein
VAEPGDVQTVEPEPAVFDRPPAWEALARALIERRPVWARYHGHERLLCPHVLGSKGLRAKLLAYQAAGTTSSGQVPSATGQAWRSMFVDEIDHVVLSGRGWQSAANYCDDAARLGMDHVEVRVPVSVELSRVSGRYG